MKYNLIRLSNSLDPHATFKKEDDEFIANINNELYDDDITLVENSEERFNIIFVETGGSEQHFIKIADKLKKPILLLSTSKNNSLPACFEIKTFLKQKYNIEPFFAFGEPNEIANYLRNISKVFQGVQFVEGKNLGVIGQPSDWLIASKVDNKRVKEVYDINLIDIPSDELKEEINKGLLKDIPNKDKYAKLAKDPKVYQGALEIYSGLKRVIEKHNLTGLTIRCFDLIGEYKNTACLALAMLNDEGITSACEGDVPSLLTMFFIRGLTGKSSFQANPSLINLKDNSVLFAHCTIPMGMCNNVEFMTHFESGLGIGIRGKLQEGRVTVLKLSPNLKDCLAIEGNIASNPEHKEYCRTQIEVKLENEELYELLNNNFGNHVIITYENISIIFHAFLSYYFD